MGVRIGSIRLSTNGLAVTGPQFWLSSFGDVVCEFCRATKQEMQDISGCLLHLQSWALYKMSFLASIGHQPPMWPLANRTPVIRNGSGGDESRIEFKLFDWKRKDLDMI
ncbi:hypothetical protein J1N35_034847 [Gossypium stocksii]|uniref:Uncharacterized protein n=1 Tax=Gossypium stocksii TaxID=47602 RepID=A0A9D3ZQX6_9ROSI|nr:hypothetical protein J1N35_034847 [Gossypium stocksii]